MMDWKEYIERDPHVMLGKPVFKGMRLAVDFVLERLAQGATTQELIENYEGLTIEHVKAAFAFAASALRHEELVAAD
jgi:uncharacterized protein (DUF433 family)